MWKKSEVWKNRKFQMLLLFEVILICFGVAGLFRKDSVVVNETSMNITLLGGEHQEDKSYYVDGASGVSGEWLVAKGFSLRPGSYELVLTYEAFENEVASMNILLDGGTFKALLANGAPVYSGVERQHLQFYVIDAIGENENLRVVLNYAGTKPLTVQGIEIVRTNAMETAFLVCMIVVSLFINCIVMFYVYMGKYDVSGEKIIAGAIVAIAVFIASHPLFVDYIILESKSLQQIPRIMELVNSTETMTYRDIESVLPFALCRLGFPIMVAYKTYIVISNIVVAVLSYICFMLLSKKNLYIGVMGSVLLTLSPLRINMLYQQKGEHMLFLWGIYMCFVVALCVTVAMIMKKGNVRTGKVIVGIISCCMCLYAMYLTNTILHTEEDMARIYSTVTYEYRDYSGE